MRAAAPLLPALAAAAIAAEPAATSATMSAAEPAATSAAEPAQEVPEFLPFMAGHVFKGCPANSVCSRATGRLRERWGRLLDEGRNEALARFAAERGVPVGVWTTDKEPREDGVVVWDPSCPDHRRREGAAAIYDGEAFVKALGGPARRRGLVGRRALVDAGRRRTAFSIPRGETPRLLRNGRLHFNGEHEGRYYGFSVGPDGRVAFEGAPPEGGRGSRAPRDAPCPEGLAKAFAEARGRDGGDGPLAAAGSRCREIWDADSGGWASVIHGTACP